jgi:glyoxylase-like metal-dependent hydrolase (beta-lactamase superfamily II)
MIEGADGFSGGNVGLLIGDERIVLIDDFVEPLSDKLLETAASIAGRPVDFVINTHVHGDHVGGNAALAGHGATIVAHDNIRTRMLADEKTDPSALPVITFSDAVTFHLNTLTAEVFHVANAHTDGDAVIRFADANVIHTGDAMFNRLFPFIDLDSGGSVSGYIAAQKKILAMTDADTKIIPGHGALATPADLKASIEMLETGRALVKELIEEGLTADEIVGANPLEDYSDWNWGFITTERMTRTFYRDLTGGEAQ